MSGHQLDDSSRRDVLQALAGAIAMPAVADGVDLDCEDRQRVPDLSRDEAFWIVLFAASKADDPDAALDRLNYVALPFAPADMGPEEAAEHVRAAARGGYDEEALEQRAAHVWGLHR